MYTEADRTQVKAMVRKRWLWTALPSAFLLAVSIAVFVLSQLRREDQGWMLACGLMILSGCYFLFLWGVYLGPIRLYAKHVEYMLDGRMRETTGLLTDIADAASDKDGLGFYAFTVNVGDRGDPEDDRLFYYDALKGRPELPLGTHVTVLSNDRMISELRKM